MHVGVATDFVGFEFFVLLVLSGDHSEFLGVVLDELRGDEQEVEGVGLAHLDIDDGLDLLLGQALLGLLVRLLLLLLLGLLVLRGLQEGRCQLTVHRGGSLVLVTSCLLARLLGLAALLLLAAGCILGSPGSGLLPRGGGLPGGLVTLAGLTL